MFASQQPPFSQVVGGCSTQRPGNRPSPRGARSPVIGFGLSKFAVKMIRIYKDHVLHINFNTHSFLITVCELHKNVTLLHSWQTSLSNNLQTTKKKACSWAISCNRRIQHQLSHTAHHKCCNCCDPSKTFTKDAMIFKEQTKNDSPVHNNGLVGGFNSIENYS